MVFETLPLYSPKTYKYPMTITFLFSLPVFGFAMHCHSNCHLVTELFDIVNWYYRWLSSINHLLITIILAFSLAQVASIQWMTIRKTSEWKKCFNISNSNNILSKLFSWNFSYPSTILHKMAKSFFSTHHKLHSLFTKRTENSINENPMIISKQ